MKIFKTYWLQKTLLWLMLLVVVNQSINAPDALENRDNNPVTLEEDLSINEMESVLELVLEKWLNIDNAFPEEEEDDSFEFQKKMSFFFPFQFFSFSFAPVAKVLLQFDFRFQIAFFQDMSLDISSPPPKSYV